MFFIAIYERTENFQFLWKIGDLQKAGVEAGPLSERDQREAVLLIILNKVWL